MAVLCLKLMQTFNWSINFNNFMQQLHWEKTRNENVFSSMTTLLEHSKAKKAQTTERRFLPKRQLSLKTLSWFNLIFQEGFKNLSFKINFQCQNQHNNFEKFYGSNIRLKPRSATKISRNLPVDFNFTKSTINWLGDFVTFLKPTLKIWTVYQQHFFITSFFLITLFSKSGPYFLSTDW